MLNLYIHIPFCASKCKYCAFYSICSQENIDKYFEELEKEILSFRKQLKNHEIATIYFGGGTPNLVDAKYITRVLDLIKKSFKTNKNVEITIECNPEFISKEKLESYKKSGINRISIGVQSFDEKVLDLVGRKWNMKSRRDWPIAPTLDNYFEFIKNKINLINQSGFNNFNLDLIFGIPQQGLASWKDSVAKAVSLNPKHISCYSLEIDKDSVLSREIKVGKLKLPSESLDRRMYYWARKFLSENGYEQYEISNFCLANYECKHNLDFWRGQDYIGFGAGASSMVGNNFWENCKLEKYLQDLDSSPSVGAQTACPEHVEGFARLHLRKSEEKILSEKEVNFLKLSRKIRLIKEGVDLNDYRFNKLKLKEIEKESLIEIKNDTLFLTEKGMDLENMVVEELSEAID